MCFDFIEFYAAGCNWEIGSIDSGNDLVWYVRPRVIIWRILLKTHDIIGAPSITKQQLVRSNTMINTNIEDHSASQMVIP